MPIRNVVNPVYTPGETPSILAKVALLAGRFTAVTADGVDTSTGLTQAGYPAANADKHSGVTLYDTAQGQPGVVQRTGVVRVITAANITAGAYVGTDAQGRAVVAASRAVALGEAWSNAASGDPVHVALF